MENLIELQSIDAKLKDINDLLGDLPSKVEDLNNQEYSMKSSLNNNKTRLKEVEIEANKRELDVAEKVEKISTLKDQLFLVTNNKQYDALMNEIDHIKAEKANFENQAIELLEEKETLQGSIKLMETELNELSQNLAVRREKLESAILESADEKSSLEQSRNEKLEQIDSSIVRIYNQVMIARDGTAVVPLVGSGCGGCGAHIPPQIVTEIRANTGMHRCDMCGRFLYKQDILVN